MLLDKGASIEAADQYGNTALHMAARIGDINLATILLDNRASIEATDHRGKTALQIAARFGYIDLVATMMLDKGAREFFPFSFF